MRVWLQLTHLFGLPEGHGTDNLMQAALGPVLRAACQDIVNAPLPEPITRLVQELALHEQATQSPVRPSSQPLTYRLRPLGQPRTAGLATTTSMRIPLSKALAIRVSPSYSQLRRRRLKIPDLPCR